MAIAFGYIFTEILDKQYTGGEDMGRISPAGASKTGSGYPLAPINIIELLDTYVPPRPLRSSSRGQSTKVLRSNTKYGNRSFHASEYLDFSEGFAAFFSLPSRIHSTHLINCGIFSSVSLKMFRNSQLHLIDIIFP